LDLDIAGEFIEMVATLLLIKVRMLLPRPEGAEEEDIEDPRSQLVAQLLEYKQFKDASFSLGDLEYRRRRHFSRSIPKQMLTVEPIEEDVFLDDVSLFDLLTAFKNALDNMPKVTVHQVSIIKVSLEEQVRFIIEQIGNRPYILFREICKQLQNKMELIVTFMAILDLARLNFLAAKQSEIFGEIRLVVLQPLTIAKYLEVRDQDLLPESSGDLEKENSESK
jgi:segregation and condensation protein A